MTKQQTIDFLINYNKWRRQSSDNIEKLIDMPNPKEIGIAIESAIKYLKQKEKNK